MISIRNAKFAKSGLHDMIKYLQSNGLDTKNSDMIEIGCYVGDSTEIFAQYFNTIYAIDAWTNGYDNNDASSYTHDMKIVEAQFDDLCNRHNNIIKIKEYSKNAVRHFQKNSMDFVYVDALHTYQGVKDDMTIYLPICRNWIGGHDYGSKHHPGVKKAVDEMIIKPDKTFFDTSWVKKI